MLQFHTLTDEEVRQLSDTLFRHNDSPRNASPRIFVG